MQLVYVRFTTPRVIRLQRTTIHTATINKYFKNILMFYTMTSMKYCYYYNLLYFQYFKVLACDA